LAAPACYDTTQKKPPVPQPRQEQGAETET